MIIINNYSLKKVISFFIVLFKDQKLLLVVALILQLGAGIAPALIGCSNGKLIDAIIGDSSSIKPFLIIFSIIVWIALGDLLMVLQGFIGDYFQNLAEHRIQHFMLQKISYEPSLEVVESPKVANLIVLAQQNVSTISLYINVMCLLIVMIISTLSSFILGGVIVWWLPFALTISMIPFIYIRTKLENELWNVKKSNAHSYSILNNYQTILTSSEFAKDTRLYGIAPLVLKKWNNISLKIYKDLNNLRIKSSIVIALFTLLSAIGPSYAFYYVISLLTDKAISLGQLSFLLSIIINLRNSITCLLHNGADVIKMARISQPIISLLSIPSSISSDNVTAHDFPLLFFDKVSFYYPESSTLVLNNISFSLHEGQSIAIVGENGSGKSTLFKLISRLYNPTSGTIYWKGQDIASLDVTEYRAQLGVMFQDFAQFPLSVKENIQMNDQDNNQISYVLNQVNLSYLNDKLNTVLCKSIEGGIDLSGGEWQRIALARLLICADTKTLLLLDEPTACLDSRNENIVFSVLKNKIVTKTSIIISHRLALCQFVNTIIVMNKGSIIDQGSHKELLQRNSSYKVMFNEQAQWYQDDK